MEIECGLVWPSTKALGPGNRFVIWTQGCLRRCFRCASPELQLSGHGIMYETGALAEKIVKSSDIEGITISGGEPLLQSEALCDLLSRVKLKRPELSVILFTGYTIGQVRSGDSKQVLEYIDVLIDGEYKEELNDNRGLRGSSNQRIHFLTPALLEHKEEFESGKRTREMHLMEDDSMLTIGIADKV